MRICRDGYAYVTNGYVAIKWKLETEPVPRDDNQKEFVIPVENLIRWYKLASTKDILNELTILDLQDKDNATSYPDMTKLFNKINNQQTCEDIDINLNLIELVNKAVDCVKCDGFNLQIHCGSFIYGRSIKQEDTEFLIAGLNK